MTAPVEQPLHIKLRPKRVDSPGMAPTTDLAALKLAWEDQGRPRVWAFVGEPGCGKTTTARALADAVQAEYRLATGNAEACILIREINVADRTGVEFARELVEQGQLRASRPVVTILDEAHKLTDAAQNALLKLLEDTPANNYIFICTTEFTKLIPAVRSRCKVVPFSALTKAQAVNWIQVVCAHLQWQAPPVDVMFALWSEAIGSPRKLLQLLQAWKTTGKIDSEPEIVGELDIRLLAKAMLNYERWRDGVGKLLKETTFDPEGARRAISGYMLGVAFNAESPEAIQKALRAVDALCVPIYQTGRDALARFVIQCFTAWQAYKKA